MFWIHQGREFCHCLVGVHIDEDSAQKGVVSIGAL